MGPVPSPRGNFIALNKQNLRNFFKERVPAENTAVGQLMKLEAEMVHPRRIFEMKQQQYELKGRTKMSLKHSFEIDLASSARP